ncbi:hypothetical protein LQQ57_24260 [Escherichia coli]|nr:hypothetical protein [Escherichia coli]
MDKNSVPADIWGGQSDAALCRQTAAGADSADENEPSFGYTLRRKGCLLPTNTTEPGGKVKYCRYTDILQSRRGWWRCRVSHYRYQ